MERDPFNVELDRLRAENERLRASLNQIADPLMLKMPGTVGMELAMKLILRMQEIAKAALVEQDSALAGGVQ